MSFSGTLVYLHGFRSGPASFKAKMIAKRLGSMPERFDGTLYVPDLGFDMSQAIKRVESTLKKRPAPFVFIGSSLGGYYATYLAERSPIVLERSPKSKVVLINPSVKPFELLVDYVGWVENIYTKERFEVKLEHMNVLKEYYVPIITSPERYFLMVKTKDEVLDYWQAVNHYRGVHASIVAGGDHSFDDLDQYLDQIWAFLGV